MDEATILTLILFGNSFDVLKEGEVLWMPSVCTGDMTNACTWSRLNDIRRENIANPILHLNTFTCLWNSGSWVADYGWVVRRGDRLWSTHGWSTNRKVRVAENEWEISGHLFPHQESLSSPWNHLLTIFNPCFFFLFGCWLLLVAVVCCCLLLFAVD